MPDERVQKALAYYLSEIAETQTHRNKAFQLLSLATLYDLLGLVYT